jgi:membrane protein
MMIWIKEWAQKPAVRYLLRLYKNINENYIGLIPAGVAFYFFLASFPALAALISLYGFFSDPNFVTTELQRLRSFLPPESFSILDEQARAIAGGDKASLGLGVIFGIMLAIYSAMRGVGALIKGLNIAYNVRERRNILILNSVAFGLTFIMMAYILLSLSLIAILPALFNILHLPQTLTETLLTLRWPLLLFMGMVGLQILYRYAPCRGVRWRWFSWGALAATIFWVGGSSLFSLFVSNFGNYNETYGSLGAVAVLLLWFWLSALSILFGAEINAALQDKGEKEHYINRF